MIAVLAGGHAAFHFNRARCVAQVEARVEAMFRADATGIDTQGIHVSINHAELWR